MQVWDLPYDGEVCVWNHIEGAGILKRLINEATVFPKYRGKTCTRYLSLACAFDIETSKVENTNWKKGDPEKFHYFSFPFCWQFMVEGAFIFGRNPADFFTMLKSVETDGVVVVYIHNINYEFGNLIDFFAANGAEIMMKNSSTPLFIRWGNFEFRCSAQLTHKPLWMLGKEIGYEKLRGDFDYAIERDWESELTPLEMNYCYRDVAILVKWIAQEAKNYTGKKNPSGLPFTQTGYVRNAIKKAFSKTPLGKMILEETAFDEDTFIALSRAFYGGYTHANFRNVGLEFSRILHFDITSAYPWALITQLFPYKMRKADIMSLDKFLADLANPMKAIIANIKFIGLHLKKGCIPYIPYNESTGKHYAENAIAENGRLLLADKYVGTFCDVDIRLFLSAYDFDEFEVIDIWTGEKRPLPKPVVDVLVEYFCNKTQYKGVGGKEYVYNLSKQLFNGIYGLSAQSLEQSNFTVNDDLTVTNKGYSYKEADVLPYQWAIYTTAYVREVIYGNILKLPDWRLFIYSDTDSIFTIYDERVVKQIETYNDKIKREVEALKEKYPNIIPCNPKGEPQYLGTLSDEEDDCVGFMTIGAKRYYIKHSDGTVDLTVSGLRATKTYYDEDENGKPVKTPEHHHNGFNTDRLIKKFGNIEKAFRAICDGVECSLPYEEGVDKLSNYVTVYPYEGILCGHKVTRPCSYTLYPVSTSLSLNEQLMNVLKMISEGARKNVVYSEIY